MALCEKARLPSICRAVFTISFYSAFSGQFFTHSRQRIHSVPLVLFLESSVMSASMWHTRLHFAFSAGNTFAFVTRYPQQWKITHRLQKHRDGTDIFAECTVVLKSKCKEYPNGIIEQIANNKRPEHDPFPVAHIRQKQSRYNIFWQKMKVSGQLIRWLLITIHRFFWSTDIFADPKNVIQEIKRKNGAGKEDLVKNVSELSARSSCKHSVFLLEKR